MINIKNLVEILGIILSIIFTIAFGPFTVLKPPLYFTIIFFIFLPGYFYFIRSVQKGYLKELKKINYNIDWFEKILFSFKEGFLLLASSTYISLFISSYLTLSLIVIGYFLDVNMLSLFYGFFNVVTIVSIFGTSIFLIFRNIKINFPHTIYNIGKEHELIRLFLVILMWLLFIYLTDFTLNLDQIYEIVKQLR